MTENRRRPPTVGDVMTRGLIVVKASAPLAEAARILDANGIHGLPVVDETGALVGVLSQTDFLRARATEHLWASWPGLSVRHLMTSPAITAPETMGLDEAARLMERRHIHRLVVVDADGTTPIGIISTGDLVHAMVEGTADA